MEGKLKTLSAAERAEGKIVRLVVKVTGRNENRG